MFLFYSNNYDVIYDDINIISRKRTKLKFESHLKSNTLKLFHKY